MTLQEPEARSRAPKPRWVRWLAGAAFWLFLLKGLAWLMLPATLVWLSGGN